MLRMKMRGCEMARLIKELAATSDNLSLGPRTHVVGGENYSYKVSSCAPHTCDSLPEYRNYRYEPPYLAFSRFVLLNNTSWELEQNSLIKERLPSLRLH